MGSCGFCECNMQPLTLAEIRTVNHEVLNKFTDAELANILNLAYSDSVGFNAVDFDDIWREEIIVEFAALDQFNVHEHPYYNADPMGIKLSDLAAKLLALTKLDKHPYVNACRILNIAAKLLISKDHKFTNQWLNERRILQTIPKGHTTNRELDAFYKIMQITVRDLLNLPADDMIHPGNLKRKLVNYVENRCKLKDGITLNEIRDLMGVALWADIINKVKQNPKLDPEEIKQQFKDVNDMIEEVYLSPVLTWVRVAYLHRVLH